MIRSFVVISLALGFASSSVAQHKPSPGTSYERLLAMTRAAIDAKEPERAGRLALLARARMLVRPNPYAEDAMLRIFDDMNTPASERAKLYLAMLGDDRKAIESLGAVSSKLNEIGEAFATQAEELLAQNYKLVVGFVIEPLWAFDPARALEIFEKAAAIDDADAADDDEATNTGLRLTESMIRGADGRLGVSVGEESPRDAEIKELRKTSAAAMVDVAQTAIDAGFPWVAVDLSQVSPVIFAISGSRFTATRNAAWKALAAKRDAASKAILAKWFYPAKKRLPNSAFTVTDGTVRFPPAKAKRGLFLSSKPITGDFRMSAKLLTDFDERQIGLVFAYKNDDDFCALYVKRFDGKPGFLMSHYVKGQPTPFGKWIEKADTVIGDESPGWPVELERHGDTLSFAIGEFAWSFVPAKDLDLTGAVGLFCDDEVTCPDTAEASRFELESLPPLVADDEK